MAGEAAATPAVRRPAAAHGLAAARRAVPRPPGGLWDSEEAAAKAWRPRANGGARERGARGGRAHDARGSAAVAAVLVARAAGRRLAPWAGGCGGRPVLDTRERASQWRLRPRYDPVSSPPDPFIVLCPWEEKHDVLERGREGRRIGCWLCTRSPGHCRGGPMPPEHRVGPPRSRCTPNQAPRCGLSQRGEGGGRAVEPLFAPVTYKMIINVVADDSE
uniref:uncharacterized protein LOC117707911 isoform X2 n=1 Tax=Arvicanthis niloticus TaxID=61156 RepID=UPI0014860DFC|nr:uncharacterized protein LOC117707911 isoform X2 [Arvicanthis niloticus]XP_034357414.1 uncharacterized protein LOC117707911 isoform X2 [Arvicanthis niloticus]